MHQKDCIENCINCYEECSSTLNNHCLPMGGKHVDPYHVKSMLDCIEICRTAADFMIRDSETHAGVCAICAEICDRCADSCETVGEMDKCAQVCRKCADSCRGMSKGKMVA